MEKYQILTVTPKRQAQRANDDTISIKVDGNEVISSKTLKILGVDLDDEMNFSRHISEIYKRSSQKVGVILRFRNLIPAKAKLGLCKSSVISQLTYCHTVWHFWRASDRRKLSRVQERALRAIFNTKADSYEELLSRANLSTLYNRRLQDIAILMFKVKQDTSPIYVKRILSQLTRGMAYVTQTSIDPVLTLYNMEIQLDI